MSNGLLVLDKPLGVTSRDAVDRAKAWFPPTARLGHAGTLDPLASGVLVLGIGSATRLIEFVQRMEKVYEASIRLGVCSSTDDAEGDLLAVPVTTPPARETVELTLTKLVGAIEQTPPAFSAAKVGGRRAYELARKGRDVDLEARRVYIHEIKLVSYSYPDLMIDVRCGKGTYIRSLARDIGEELGTGAMLSSLRRTRIGPFTLETALPISADEATAHKSLRPLADAVGDLPRVVLSEEMLAHLRRGRSISVEPNIAAHASEASEAAIFDHEGELVGVGAFNPKKGVLAPHKILSGAVG